MRKSLKVSNGKKSLSDKYIKKIKNHKFISALIILSFILTLFTSIYSPIKDLWKLNPYSKETIFVDITVHNRKKSIDENVLPNNYFLGQNVPQYIVPPIIEVKLVNNTSKTEFLKEIKINATLLSGGNSSMIAACAVGYVTGFYNVGLNLNESFQNKVIPISHYLKPKDIDRLMISFAPNGGGGYAEFKLDLSFVSVGGNEWKSKSVKIDLVKRYPCEYPARSPLSWQKL